MRLSFDAPPIDILLASLPEAVAWWTARPKAPTASLGVDEPDPALRSMRLLPPLFAEPKQSVWALVEARRYSLGITTRGQPTGTPSLAGGRLLYYEPDRNLSDGAACRASGGFFDVENIPPWDVWLCFADHRLLVAWVAPEDLSRAEAGIYVNPERCVTWAGDIDTPFNEHLRTQGLLSSSGAIGSGTGR